MVSETNSLELSWKKYIVGKALYGGGGGGEREGMSCGSCGCELGRQLQAAAW